MTKKIGNVCVDIYVCVRERGMTALVSSLSLSLFVSDDDINDAGVFNLLPEY